MLQLRDKIGTFDNFTFYADFEDPNQFWYIPEQINFSKREDGTVLFSLIQFTGDDPESDGGYLNFQVDMAVDESKLDAAFDKYLKSINYQGNKNNANKAVVPYDEGTVQFLVLQGDNNSLGKLVNTQSPSLIGKNAAIFSAFLTANESQICEAIFQEAAAPAAVYYTLTYTGIVPALNIRVEANFESIYNEFDIKFGASVISLDPPLQFYLGFNAVIKDLIERGNLKIEIVDHGGDPNKNEKDKEWVMEFVKVEILKSFFKATIDVNEQNNDQAVPSSEALLSNLYDMLKKEEEKKKKKKEGVESGKANANKLAAADEPTPSPIPALSLNIKMVSISEAKSFNLNYNLARAAQQTISPQSFLGTDTITVKKEPPYYIKKKLNDPFFAKMELNVYAPSEFTPIGLQAASSRILYDGSVYEPSFSKPMEDPWKKEISRSGNLDTPLSITKTYNYLSASTTGIEGKTQIISETSSLGNTISMEPSNEIQTVDVRIMANLVKFEDTPLVEVKVTYQEPDVMQKDKVFFFTEEDPRQQHFKYRQISESPWVIAYQIIYHFSDGHQETFTSPPNTPVSSIFIPAKPPKKEDYACLRRTK